MAQTIRLWPAAHVAGGEDAGNAGGVIVVALHVAARVELQAQLADRAVVFGVDETERQQAKIAIQRRIRWRGFRFMVKRPLRSFDHSKRTPWSFLTTPFSPLKALGVDGEIADFLAGQFVGFFVGAAGAEDHRPFWPGLDRAIDDGFGRARIRAAGRSSNCCTLLQPWRRARCRGSPPRCPRRRG